MNSSKDKVVTK